MMRTRRTSIFQHNRALFISVPFDVLSSQSFNFCLPFFFLFFFFWQESHDMVLLFKYSPFFYCAGKWQCLKTRRTRNGRGKRWREGLFLGEAKFGNRLMGVWNGTSELFKMSSTYYRAVLIPYLYS